MTAKVQKLEEKMKKDIEGNGVSLTDSEVIIVSDLIKDASDTVHSLLKNSVQHIFVGRTEEVKCPKG